jgi:hypothetical protein
MKFELPTFTHCYETMKDALDEAETMAVTCRDHPDTFVAAIRGRWYRRFAMWRPNYRNGDPIYTPYSEVDNIDYQAWTYLVNQFPGMGIPAIDPRDLRDKIYPGSSLLSEAVLRAIAEIRHTFSYENMSQLYTQFENNVMGGHGSIPDFSRLGRAEARNIYLEKLFRPMLLQLNILYNTMVHRMEQGKRPEPKPSPDEYIIITAFGKKIRVSAKKPALQLTVAELLAMLRMVRDEKGEAILAMMGETEE